MSDADSERSSECLSDEEIEQIMARADRRIDEFIRHYHAQLRRELKRFRGLMILMLAVATFSLGFILVVLGHTPSGLEERVSDLERHRSAKEAPAAPNPSM